VISDRCRIFFNLNKVLSKIQFCFLFLVLKSNFQNEIIIQQQDAEPGKLLRYVVECDKHSWMPK